MNANASPEGLAKVASVESHLSELDPLLREFCSRHGYLFSSSIELWPRRRMWRREEIDRCLDLTSDIGVQELLDRGFYPELPWSLHATGSLRPGDDYEMHILTRPVFEQVPFHQLAVILPDSLERGVRLLFEMNEHTIRAKGMKCHLDNRDAR